MPVEKKILISVITCFFNEQRFLEETVASVFAQTYPDWELILVDDGSSDDSTRQAKEWAQKHPGKCFYYDHPNHENQGHSASRSRGLGQARGEWIALLDADDIWAPDKLSSQVEIIKANPRACMVCEASEYWYDWMPGSRKNVILKVGGDLDGLYEPPDLLKVLYPLANGAAPCPSAVLIKKEAIHDVGGFEEHFRGIYQVYEDQAFLAKIYLEKPVHISPLSHNKYRQREGSLVSEMVKKGNYDKVRRYFLEWFEKYIETKGLADREIRWLLRKALFKSKNKKLWKLYLRLAALAEKVKYKKIKRILRRT
jgi:glycosyltransferase involved in cell wall biosynthesis